MPRQCNVCGKLPLAANLVSHANNKTHTRKMPNLQKVRALIEGQVRKILACTRCIRSGFVTKSL